MKKILQVTEIAESAFIFIKKPKAGNTYNLLLVK